MIKRFFGLSRNFRHESQRKIPSRTRHERSRARTPYTVAATEQLEQRLAMTISADLFNFPNRSDTVLIVGIDDQQTNVLNVNDGNTIGHGQEAYIKRTSGSNGTNILLADNQSFINAMTLPETTLSSIYVTSARRVAAQSTLPAVISSSNGNANAGTYTASLAAPYVVPGTLKGAGIAYTNTRQFTFTFVSEPEQSSTVRLLTPAGSPILFQEFDGNGVLIIRIMGSLNTDSGLITLNYYSGYENYYDVLASSISHSSYLCNDFFTLPQKFTLDDGLDINQRLMVNLQPVGSRIFINSPIVATRGTTADGFYSRYGGTVTARLSSETTTTGTLLAGPHISLDAEYIDINASMRANDRVSFGMRDALGPGPTSFTLQNPLRELAINQAIYSQSFGIQASGSPIQSGIINLSKTGILAANTANSNASNIIVMANDADIRIAGDIRASEQSYLLRSTSTDKQFSFTTRSTVTNLPVGKLYGTTLAATLGTIAGGTVDLQTQIEKLRIISANEKDAGIFPYTITIAEEDDISIDAIISSRSPISISAGKRDTLGKIVAPGGLISVNAPVQTAGDINLAAAGNLTLDASMSSAAGNINISAESLVLNGKILSGSERNLLLTTYTGDVTLNGVLQAGGIVKKTTEWASQENFSSIYNSGTGILTGIRTENTFTDGVSLVIGDRVLIKNQIDKSQNGIYDILAPQTASATTTANVGFATTDLLAGSYAKNTDTGTGATITGSLPGFISAIDAVTPKLNDRILVKNGIFDQTVGGPVELATTVNLDTQDVRAATTTNIVTNTVGSAVQAILPTSIVRVADNKGVLTSTVVAASKTPIIGATVDAATTSLIQNFSTVDLASTVSLLSSIVNLASTAEIVSTVVDAATTLPLLTPFARFATSGNLPLPQEVIAATTAALNANAASITTKRVSSIGILNTGNGYSSAPIVTITDKVGGTGFGATAVAVLGTGINQGKVIAITITDGGFEYESPTCTISGGGGSGAIGDIPVLTQTSIETLNFNANGLIPIVDGITLTTGDRILVKDQQLGKNASEANNNGVYRVARPGSPTTISILIRTDDFDNPPELSNGVVVRVAPGGVVNADTRWLQNSPTPTKLGLNSITFVQATTNLSLPPLSLNALSIGVGGNIINVSDRILIKDQTDARDNGVYVITQIGNPNTPWLLERASDFDQGPELRQFVSVRVSAGTFQDQLFYQSQPAQNPILGTDKFTFINGNLYLSGSGNGKLPLIDGQDLSVGTQVLLKDQANKIDNGIYQVTDLGSNITPWILSRTGTFNSSATLSFGTGVRVIAGTTNTNSRWYQSTKFPNLGTSNLVYVASMDYLSGSGTILIDNTNVSINDTLLLKNQTKGSDNGVYNVLANNASGWILKRSDNFNEPNELVADVSVRVTNGVVNKDYRFGQKNTQTIVIGTTDLVFDSSVGFNSLSGQVYGALPSIDTKSVRQATATATINTNTKIVNIPNIVDGGAGYAIVPTVTFDPAPAGGETATGVAVLGTGSQAGTVVSITNFKPGSGYLTNPRVTISGPKVLLKDQSNKRDNGVYEIKQTGSNTTPWILIRSDSFNDPNETTVGRSVGVLGGAVALNKSFVQTQTITKVGLQDMIFNINGTIDPNTLGLTNYDFNSKTLSSLSFGLLPIIGGMELSLGQRLLVKNQSDARNNGIYTVHDLGSATTPWILKRSDDFNTSAEIASIGSSGVSVLVPVGTQYQRWELSTQNAILDASALNFEPKWQTICIPFNSPDDFKSKFDDSSKISLGNQVLIKSQSTQITILVTKNGSGYTSVPIVTITSTGVSGSGATAIANLGSGSDSDKVVSITITNSGSGYTLAPSVTITGGGGSGAECRAFSPVISSSDNGIYTILREGTATTGWLLGRSDEFNSSVELNVGVSTFNEGDKRRYSQINPEAVTLGITPLIFAQDYTTLSGIAPLIIDGIQPVIGEFILLSQQKNDFDNGIYRVLQNSDLTQPSTPWIIKRAESFNSIGELIQYSGARVWDGTNIGRWQQTSDHNAAIAIGKIDANKLTGYTLSDQGSGYVRAPNVLVTGGGGSGATATANMGSGLNSDKVISITIDNPGSGYTSVPNITLDDLGAFKYIFSKDLNVDIANYLSGDGAGVLNLAEVIAVKVDDGGSGYFVAPTVTFDPAPNGGVTATGVAVLSANKVTGITMTNRGSGYVTAPTITIQAPTGGGVTASATATLSEPQGKRSEFTFNFATDGSINSSNLNTLGYGLLGAGFTEAPKVTITGSQDSANNATATAILGTGQNKDKVVGIKIDNPGKGYSDIFKPVYSFTSNQRILISRQGGTFATARSEIVNGRVSLIQFLNGGQDYNVLPAITIAEPVKKTAILNPVIVDNKLVRVDVVDGGSGYSTNSPLQTKTVIFNQILTVTGTLLISNGRVEGVALNDIDVAVLEGLSATAAVPMPVQASAVVTKSDFNQTGTIVSNSAELTSGGDGYTSAPTVTIDWPTNSQDNGVYTVVSLGSDTEPWVLKRAADFDRNAELTTGVGTYVESGNDAGKRFEQTLQTSIKENNSFGFLESYQTLSGNTLDGLNTFKAIDGVSVSLTTVLRADIKTTGSGYTSPPTVTFSPAPAGGVTATGVTVLLAGQVTGITITNPGSGYITAPAITIGPSPAGGKTATATAVLSSPFTILVKDQVRKQENGIYTLERQYTASDSPWILRRHVNNDLITELVPGMSVYVQDGYINNHSRFQQTVSATNSTNPIANTLFTFTERYDTLTGLGSTKLQDIDGLEPVVGNRILVKDQTRKEDNGIYVVSQLGDSSSPWILTRAFDFGGPDNSLYPEISRATATSTIKVTGVTGIVGGSGYTVAPTVTFSPAPVGGVTATGVAVLGTGLLTGQVIGITITNSGSGYVTAPAITISPSPSGKNATATATFALSAANISTSGSGYTIQPKVTFSRAPAGGVTATGVAILGTGSDSNKVIRIDITKPGSGYISPPIINLLTNVESPLGTIVQSGASNRNNIFSVTKQLAIGNDAIVFERRSQTSGLPDIANGIYIVSDIGSLTTPFVLTRSSEMIEPDQFNGNVVLTSFGSVNSGSAWKAQSLADGKVSYTYLEPMSLKRSPDADSSSDFALGFVVYSREATGGWVFTNASAVRLGQSNIEFVPLSSTHTFNTVRAASTSNIDSLTSFTGKIDNITINDSDRVLIAEQTNQSENGIYVAYNTDTNYTIPADVATTLNIPSLNVRAASTTRLDGKQSDLLTNSQGSIFSTAAVNQTFSCDPLKPAQFPKIDGVSISVGDRILLKNQATDLSVIFSPPTLTVARAYPVFGTALSNFIRGNIILSIRLQDSGTGYTTVPNVTISAPTQGDPDLRYTATAVAVLDPSGKLSSITVTSSGWGYDPLNTTISIDSPDAVAATAKGTLKVNSSGQASQVLISYPGLGYTQSSRPTATVLGVPPSVAANLFVNVAEGSGGVSSVEILSPGAGYSQDNNSQNGIYILVNSGSSTAPWMLKRADDFDTQPEVLSGASIRVTEGVLNQHLRYSVKNSGLISVGYNPLSFEESYGYSSYPRSRTLSGKGSLPSIDSVFLEVGQRILVKNQTVQSENGIYTVSNTGGLDQSWLLTRADDANLENDFTDRFGVTVRSGKDNTNRSFVIDSLPKPFQLGNEALGKLLFSSPIPNSLRRSGDADSAPELISGSTVYISDGELNKNRTLSLTQSVNQIGISPIVFSELAGSVTLENVKAASTVDLGNGIVYASLQQGSSFVDQIIGRVEPLIVDGIILKQNDRILLKNQSDLTKNGVYKVTEVSEVSRQALPVRVSTTANLQLKSDTRLTLSGVGPLPVIGGLSLSLGNRVLVKDQVAATQNGIYDVTRLGGPTLCVSMVTIFKTGTKYTSEPTVTIRGGKTSDDVGTVALGRAIIDKVTQQVIGVVITDAGSGYTSLPTITIEGGGGTGAVATASLAGVNEDWQLTRSSDFMIDRLGVRVLEGDTANKTYITSGLNAGNIWKETTKAWELTLADDFQLPNQQGTFVYVEQGYFFGNTGWTLDNNIIDREKPISFSPFGGTTTINSATNINGIGRLISKSAILNSGVSDGIPDSVPFGFISLFTTIGTVVAKSQIDLFSSTVNLNGSFSSPTVFTQTGSGVSYNSTVIAATIDNIPNAVYGGNFRTLQGTAADPGLPLIDGVTVRSGQSILIKDQVDPRSNGVYIVSNPGTALVKATANATSNQGSVRSLTIVNNGSGYSLPPNVTISPPNTGNDQAVVEAVLLNGRVVSLIIVNPGTGYTQDPVVTFSSPFNTNPDRFLLTRDPRFDDAAELLGVVVSVSSGRLNNNSVFYQTNSAFDGLTGKSNALLFTASTGSLPIAGVTAGQYVLLQNQTVSSENGIYLVTSVGLSQGTAITRPWQLTRTSLESISLRESDEIYLKSITTNVGNISIVANTSIYADSVFAALSTNSTSDPLSNNGDVSLTSSFGDIATAASGLISAPFDKVSNAAPLGHIYGPSAFCDWVSFTSLESPALEFYANAKKLSVDIRGDGAFKYDAISSISLATVKTSGGGQSADSGDIIINAHGSISAYEVIAGGQGIVRLNALEDNSTLTICFVKSTADAPLTSDGRIPISLISSSSILDGDTTFNILDDVDIEASYVNVSILRGNFGDAVNNFETNVSTLSGSVLSGYFGSGTPAGGQIYLQDADSIELGKRFNWGNDGGIALFADRIIDVIAKGTSGSVTLTDISTASWTENDPLASSIRILAQKNITIGRVGSPESKPKTVRLNAGQGNLYSTFIEEQTDPFDPSTAPFLGLQPSIASPTISSLISTKPLKVNGRVMQIGDGVLVSGQGNPQENGLYIVTENSNYTTLAKATANVLGGKVVTLSVTNKGQGYHSRPQVVLSPPVLSGGRPATAIALMGKGIDEGKVIGYTITDSGAGYVAAPTVTLVSRWVLTGAEHSSASSVNTQNLDITSGSLDNLQFQNFDEVDSFAIEVRSGNLRNGGVIFDRSTDITFTKVDVPNGNIVIKNRDVGNFIISNDLSVSGYTGILGGSSSDVLLETKGDIRSFVSESLQTKLNYAATPSQRDLLLNSASIGTIQAGGIVTLRASTAIDVRTKAGALSAETLSPEQPGKIIIRDVQTSTNAAVGIGPAGIVASNNGTVLLSVSGKLLQNYFSGSIEAYSADLSARTGINVKTKLSSVIAVSSAGDISLSEFDDLSTSGSIVAQSGSVIISTGTGALATTGSFTSEQPIIASKTILNALKRGDIYAKTSTGEISGFVSSGKFEVNDLDSLIIGKPGIVSGVAVKSATSGAINGIYSPKISAGRLVTAATSMLLPAKYDGQKGTLTGDVNGSINDLFNGSGIDGFNLMSVNQELLVKNKSVFMGVISNDANGIYVIKDIGSENTPWILKRISENIPLNTVVAVLNGAHSSTMPGINTNLSTYQLVSGILGVSPYVFSLSPISSTITANKNEYLSIGGVGGKISPFLMGDRILIKDDLEANQALIPIESAVVTNGPLKNLVGLLTIDGIKLKSGQIVLVKDQISPRDNGLYIASSGGWIRKNDWGGAIKNGMGIILGKTSPQVNQRGITYILSGLTSTDGTGTAGINSIYFTNTTSARGIYTVTNPGSNSSRWILTRSFDADTAADMPSDLIINVTSGSQIGAWKKSGSTLLDSAGPNATSSQKMIFSRLPSTDVPSTSIILKSTKGSISVPTTYQTSEGLIIGGNLEVTASSGITLHSEVATFTATNTTGEISLLESSDIALQNVSNSKGSIRIQSAAGSVVMLDVQTNSTNGTISVSAKNDITLERVSSNKSITINAEKEIKHQNTAGSGISSISISNPGLGYYSVPTVRISGGGGVGATATAVISGGKVTGITITSSGSGYTSIPTVIIGNVTNGTSATAIASLPAALTTIAANLEGKTGVSATVNAQSIVANSPQGSVSIVVESAEMLTLGKTAKKGSLVSISAKKDVTVRSTASDVVVLDAPLSTDNGKINIGSDNPMKSVTFVVNSTSTTSPQGTLPKLLDLRLRNLETQNTQDFRFASTLTGTIQLNSKLPEINKPITLNGGKRFVIASGTALDLQGTTVSIAGSSSGGADGFVFKAGSEGSTISNFSLGGFSLGSAVKIDGVNGITVSNSVFGQDAIGRALSNKFGIQITGRSDSIEISGNTIVNSTTAGIDVSSNNLTITNKKASVATTGALDATFDSTIKTLTSNLRGKLEIDGQFLTLGDRVLVKNQPDDPDTFFTQVDDRQENGLYLVTNPGTLSTPWQLTREPDPINVVVTGGNTQAGAYQSSLEPKLNAFSGATEKTVINYRPAIVIVGNTIGKQGAGNGVGVSIVDSGIVSIGRAMPRDVRNQIQFNGTGIKIKNATSINTIINSDVHSNTGDGIQITGVSQQQWIGTSKIASKISNAIYSNGGDGVSIEGGAPAAIHNAFGNYIGTTSPGRSNIGNRNNGIHTEGSVNSDIQGNFIFGSGTGGFSSGNKNGILLDSTGKTEVVNNTVTANKGDGLRATKGNLATITGNVFSSNSETGIDIATAVSASTMTNNTVTENLKHGIWVENTTNSRVTIDTNNIISSNKWSNLWYGISSSPLLGTTSVSARIVGGNVVVTLGTTAAFSKVTIEGGSSASNLKHMGHFSGTASTLPVSYPNVSKLIRGSYIRVVCYSASGSSPQYRLVQIS